MSAFEELKSRLMSPPILALLLKDEIITVETNACGQQVGAELLQDFGTHASCPKCTEPALELETKISAFDLFWATRYLKYFSVKKLLVCTTY